VVSLGQEIIDVEHRDLSAPTVLAEFGVVDGAMMIHHIDSAAVLAHDEVGWIAEQTPSKFKKPSLRHDGPPLHRPMD